MTSKEKINWLNRAKDIDRKIQSRCDERSIWMSRATQITPTLSDMPKGGQQENKIESAIEKIMELESEIDTEIDEYIKVKTEVKSAVSMVKNGTYREVLDRRYIRGQKFEEIAVEMNYTYRNVCYLHGKALNMVNIS